MRALLLSALLLSACESVVPSHPTDLSTTSDASTTTMDLAAIDALVPLDFEQFVVDLILDHTDETSAPVTLDDKTFVDSMNPATLAALF